MILGFLLPAIAASMGGAAAIFGLLAWVLLSASYVPMLRYHRLPWWLAPSLPLTALFYLGATLDSAWRHWQGKGGAWKGRFQAMR